MVSYIASLPPLRNVLAQSEPRRVKSASHAFLDVFKRKGGDVQEVVLEGHDHVSPVLSLSSGIGEDWGEEATEWILGLVQGSTILHTSNSQEKGDEKDDET